MKKIFLFGMLGCMALSIQAKVLRVSNVTGSNAPYTTYADAEAAAEEGDTIVFEGSNDSYQVDSIQKRLVLVGPGYWMTENGIVNEGGTSAKIINNGALPIVVCNEGTVLQGLDISDWIYLIASKCIITRSLVRSEIAVNKRAVGTVIHQNCLNGTYSGVYGCDTVYYDRQFGNCSVGNKGVAQYASITNNVISRKNSYGSVFDRLDNSYIAYNTFWAQEEYYVEYCFRMIDVTNSNFEYNFIPYTKNQPNFYKKLDDSNMYGDDQTYFVNDTNEQVFPKDSIYTTDLNVMVAELKATDGKHGAFAGTDPYVISGVPAGPVIEDVTMPVSVEQGKPLEVTVKVKIQQ